MNEIIRIKAGFNNFKKYWKKYKLKKKTILQILNRGMQTQFIYVLWPVFLFFNGVGIIEIGIIGLILSAAEAIAPLLLGKIADLDHGKLHRFATLGLFFSWLIALFANNHLILYLLSFVIGILNEALWLSINQKMTSLGKEYSASYFATIHEMSDDFAKGLVLAMMIPVIFLFGLNAAFVAMILISLFFIVAIRK